jgi:hypothetical protein
MATMRKSGYLEAENRKVAYNDTHITSTTATSSGRRSRKPGAFAAYRYRDDLFPSVAFRRAYDLLGRTTSVRADREYVRVLHLAATLSEVEVETALLLLEEAGTLPTAEAVRELVRPIAIQQVVIGPINFQPYDQLLPSQRCAHA